MKSNSERHDIHEQSAVAAGSVPLRYGVADSFIFDVSPKLRVAKNNTTHNLKFFIGELIGTLFIALSTMYIMIVPASAVRPGELRVAMRKTMKRFLDIIGATVGLLLSLPVMLIVALLIKLDSRGPVFYTQVRIGENRRRCVRRYSQWAGVQQRRQRDRRREDYLGMPFKIIKFRTMVHLAEMNSGPVWATRDDPRITRLGSVLRMTRLDELPQLWSILKGDMSLVGPRPERPVFVRDLSARVTNYSRRLDVKPGLTGLAQVENGYDSSVASVAEKVKFDLQYIRSCSMLTDLRILLRTVVVVLTGKGAC